MLKCISALTLTTLLGSAHLWASSLPVPYCNQQLVRSEPENGVVEFEFQDEKLAYYQRYLKAKELLEAERAKRTPKLLQIKTQQAVKKPIRALKAAWNSLTGNSVSNQLVRQSELDRAEQEAIFSDLPVLPELKKPREMSSPNFITRGKVVKFYGDLALFIYYDHPHNAEIELRNLRTGSLVASLEWDEASFGMHDIDGFTYDPATKIATMHVDTFFGETPETKDKSAFLFWNTETGETERLLAHQNYVKISPEDEWKYHGQHAAGYTSPDARHPYFLHGLTPTGDDVNVQILNLQTKKGLTMADASIETFRTVDREHTLFNTVKKTVTYLRKNSLEVAQVPFSYIEAATDSIPATASPRAFVHTAWVKSVESSPSGDWLVTLAGESLHLWNTTTGEKVMTFPVGTNRALTKIKFAPGEKTLFVHDSEDDRLTVIDLRQPDAIRELVVDQLTSDHYRSLSIASDGSFAVVHGPKSKWLRIELPELKVVRLPKLQFEYANEQRSYYDDLTFLSPDHTQLYAFTKHRPTLKDSDSYYLEVVRLDTGELVKSEKLYTGHSLRAASVSDDHRYFVFGWSEDERLGASPGGGTYVKAHLKMRAFQTDKWAR